MHRLQRDQDAGAEHHPDRPEVAAAGGQPDPDHEDVDDRELSPRRAQPTAPLERAQVGVVSEVGELCGRAAQHDPRLQRRDQPDAQQRPDHPRFGAPVSTQTATTTSAMPPSIALRARSPCTRRAWSRSASASLSSGRLGIAPRLGSSTACASGIAARIVVPSPGGSPRRSSPPVPQRGPRGPAAPTRRRAARLRRRHRSRSRSASRRAAPPTPSRGLRARACRRWRGTPRRRSRPPPRPGRAAAP